MTTPNIDTKALRELLVKATPGPWEVETKEHLGENEAVIGESYRVVSNHYSDETPGVCGNHSDDWTLTNSDAEAIVALRNAAPALLDLAERAQEQAKEIETLRAKVTELGDTCKGWHRIGSKVIAERDEIKMTLAAAEVIMGELHHDRDALKAEVAWRQGAHDTLFKTASEIQAERNDLRSKLSASEREAERLTAEREDLLKSRDRVIAERNEQSGLRDKLIERMTASDETWSEALGNERKLRDASEREVERLREALTTIDEAFAEGGFFDDGFARSTIRAALRGEEAPRE